MEKELNNVTSCAVNNFNLSFLITFSLSTSYH